MNGQDENPFKELMLMIASTWDKPITGAKSKAWWMVFNRYEFQDLEAAVFKHMADEQKGRFDPKPADILAHMPEIKQLVIEDKGGLSWCDNTQRLMDKYLPLYVTNTDNLKVEK